MDKKHERMWEEMKSYTQTDIDSMQVSSPHTALYIYTLLQKVKELENRPEPFLPIPGIG